MKIRRKWLLLASSGLMLGACASEPAPEPRLVPASRTSPAGERAIEELASLRCDHEQLCNKIGPNATYANRDQCLTIARRDAQGELGGCRIGVDQEALPDCFAKIAEQDCDHLVDSVARISECRMTSLCVD
jgi:hypothetical protein